MKFVKKLLKFLLICLGLETTTEFVPNDNNRREKFIKSLDDYSDPFTWKFWSCFLPLLVFWVLDDFVGEWLWLIYFSALRTYISFVLPFVFFRNIEKNHVEDWRKKKYCILFIFVIWISTALQAYSLFFGYPTTVIAGIYLRIVLISLCILANILSTAYAYIKYIRVLKDAVNEKKEKIWSEHCIWLFTSQKASWFEIALFLCGLIVFYIWGIESLPTLVNIVCMCWSFVCPFLLWKNIDRSCMGPKFAKSRAYGHSLLAWLLLFLNAVSMFVLCPVFNIYIIYLQRTQVAFLCLANICSMVLLRYKYKKEFVLNKEVEGEINTTNNVLQ